MASTLVAEERPRWWQWPTVLSLDAPLVTVLWHALLARVVLLPLNWAAAAVVGLSVWLAYAADRWIEGWRLDRSVIQTPRHRFYQRFRWPVAAAWVVVCALDVWLAFSRLGRAELLAGFVLLATVGAYLLSHQLVHRHRRWRVPKEICIAALLSGGAAVFLLRSPALSELPAPLALFALLCFANCALISVWEREVDLAHGQSSLAVDYRGSAWFIRRLPWVIAAVAVVAMLADGGAGSTAAGCAAASAVLLAVVDWVERRRGWRFARVLSDLALVSPAVPLLWM